MNGRSISTVVVSSSKLIRTLSTTTTTTTTTTTLPKSMKWTQIVPIPDPEYGSPCSRSSHGVSYLPNQKRLVVLGGEHIPRTPISEKDGPHWIADIVDDGIWQWRRLQPSSTMATVKPPPRLAHAQAAYQDSVYIFGGRAGVAMNEEALNDLWKLDCSGPPGSETWSQLQTTTQLQPEARSFHRMINVGSSLYVFGGCGASGRLADLYRFDLHSSTWHDLGSSQLRGRGGTNLLPFSNGTQIGAIAGFAGEETRDGHMYNLSTKEGWDEKVFHLHEMRPRSVCVSGSFPSLGYSIIFGGEVDPSDLGHEGAGSFENDIVVLNETDGSFLLSSSSSSSVSPWPMARGWSDGSAVEWGDGTGSLFVFGGLAGDDATPIRLDDLWELKIET